MKRLIDKLVLLVCCCSLLAQQIVAPSMAVTACLLVCIAMSALFEFAPTRVRFACPLVICIATVFIQGGASLLPLAAYDATCLFVDIMKRGNPEHPLTAWLVHIPWVAFLLFALASQWVEVGSFMFSLAICLVACLLSWKTSCLLSQDVELHTLRDTLQEKIDLLSRKNAELMEARDRATRVAVLTERARISREIHDSVGHLLTRSILQIEALKAVHAGDPDTVGELATTAATMREALETTRLSMRAMSDEAFDLGTELHRLAEDGAIESVTIDYDVIGDVPADAARCLFAVARESLTNAVHHGHASRANIHVTEFPALWQLVVSNDGIVPDLHANGESRERGLVSDLSVPGMGIRSMRERAEALGGTFRISCEHGFKVFVSIPKKEVR